MGLLLFFPLLDMALVIILVLFWDTQSKGNSSSRRRGIVNIVHRFKQL